MLPNGVFASKYEHDVAILRTKTQWALILAAVAVLFAMPLLVPQYWITWLIGLSVVIIAVLGLHVLTGLCGVFSIGQAAFMGVGAYTTAILAGRYGISGWACLPMAALSAGLIGVLMGLPSFRLKGFYIAVASLAANFIIIWCITYFSDWTGGSGGLGVMPLTLGGIALTSQTQIYFVAIVLVILGTYFAKNLQRMPLGRAFVAIRDNELAAEVGGINLFRYKTLAFFIGCMYAGVAGWLLAYSQFWVSPEQYSIHFSIWYFGMLAVGGLGSTSGVFLGVVSFKLLERLIDELVPLVPVAQFSVAMSLILYAAVILTFLIIQPGGLYSLWLRFQTYYRLRPYSYRGG